jgi:hypothetical protein
MIGDNDGGVVVRLACWGGVIILLLLGQWLG